MIKRFFRWLSNLGKAAVVGTEVVNTVANVQKEEPKAVEEKKQVQEVAYFTRANNLIQEFVADPIPISSSNFSDPRPVGYIINDRAYHRDGTPMKMVGDEFDDIDNNDLKHQLLKKANESSTFVMPVSPMELIRKAEMDAEIEDMERHRVDSWEEKMIDLKQKQAIKDFPEYNWKVEGEEKTED